MNSLVKIISSLSLITFVSACGGGGGGGSSESNTAPTVVLAETTITATSGDTLTLDASGSSDVDGDALSFSWSGSVESPSSASTEVIGLGVGEHSFTVTVSDGEDSSIATIAVTIEDFPILEALDLSTGTVAAPVTVYYDLDNNQEVALSAEEAETNTEWDIAFRRTNVYLNQNSASLYFLSNTDEFYDETTGDPVLDRFLNATAETELSAFEALDPSIPEAAEFSTDETVAAIDGWYNYDFVSHTVSAASDMYFIVDSDDAMTKFNVTELVQNGFGLDSITFTTAYQAEGLELFADEQTLTALASDCDADAVYIDFDTNTIVGAADAWDLSLVCADGLIGFDINIADDARAINDQEQADAVGIAEASENFFDWVANVAVVSAYVEFGDSRSTYGWGEYGLNGGFLLWQNFAAYIIQTDSAYYKFQITSYYDSTTFASGTYSFRYQLIEE